MAGLLEGGGSSVDYRGALEGLSAQDAGRVPPGLPHSVLHILAHVQLWQAHLLSGARGENPPDVAHAQDGWPNTPDWDALQAEFWRDLAALQTLARDPGFTRSSDHTGRPWSLRLLHFAGHNVHHLGQIITVRQALGLWPPPGGGDTW